MPLHRPTLADIIRRVTSDLEYELGSDAARFEGTIERAFVKAVAGASHGMHGRLAWIALNAFAQSCEDEQLVKLAAFFGVFKTPAVRATGNIRFYGNVGLTLDAGTMVARADGVQYETLEAGTMGGGANAVIACRAVVAGEAGNAEPGTSTTHMTPISGFQSFAEVEVGGMTGGVDEESTLALRTRLLERLANPPSGGGPGSYIKWAKEVAGVTRVWEFGKIPALGHVTVLFMRDEDDDPFPSAPEIEAVEAKILEYAPLHLAGLHVDKPIEKAIALTIEITPDSSDLRDAVVEAIQNMLALEAEPPAADGTTFYKSKIAEAIGGVDGIEDYKLTVPAGDITVDQFELLTLDAGDVTWV